MWRRSIVLLLPFSGSALADSPPTSPAKPATLQMPKRQIAVTETNGPTLSLHKLLAYADLHAPALVVERSKEHRGRALQEGARIRLPEDPTLHFSAGRRSENDASSNDYSVSLEQRFEVAGQRGLRIDAANAATQRIRADLEAVRWRVHQNVHRAFHEALVARARNAAAVEVARFNERLVDIAKKRAAAGDIPLLHVKLAEAELAIATEQRIHAEQNEFAARLTLAEVSGWPAGTPPVPAGTLDVPRSPPPLAELLKKARNRHPSLKALSSRVDETTAAKALAERKAWPDLNLGFSWAREAAPGAAGQEDGPTVATVSIGFSLPLWQRNRTERALARADQLEAKAELQSFLQTVEAKVLRSTSAVTAAAARLKVYGTEIVPKFAENLKLLGRAFELGEIDVLQVLVARERFLQLERAALDAFIEYYAAVAELENELGQEIWPDEHHDEVQGEKP